MSRPAGPAEPVCEKGTMHGRAAMESAYGFARCVLRAGHMGRCDSGEPPTPEPSLSNDRKAA